VLKAERVPEILTPEQAADYLQINRETVYRYIREGKLTASKLGRNYRIPRASVDLLLWATRTRSDVTLRQYSGREIEEFLQADQLDEEARRIADRVLNIVPPTSNQPADETNNRPPST
jgi:excisionase family DNA binding protein